MFSTWLDTILGAGDRDLMPALLQLTFGQLSVLVSFSDGSNVVGRSIFDSLFRVMVHHCEEVKTGRT